MPQIHFFSNNCNYYMRLNKDQVELWNDYTGEIETKKFMNRDGARNYFVSQCRRIASIF